MDECRGREAASQTFSFPQVLGFNPKTRSKVHPGWLERFRHIDIASKKANQMLIPCIQNMKTRFTCLVLLFITGLSLARNAFSSPECFHSVTNVPRPSVISSYVSCVRRVFSPPSPPHSPSPLPPFSLTPFLRALVSFALLFAPHLTDRRSCCIWSCEKNSSWNATTRPAT